MAVHWKKFLKRSALAVAFAASAMGFYSFKIEPDLLKTRTYDLDTAKWPENQPPLHIAVASDFHVGCPSVGLDRLAKIVDRINAMKPDIILLPGDFVTMKGKGRVLFGEYVEPKAIAGVLKNLKAPLGVYAVLGNHEEMNDAPGMRKALEDVGIRVLDNDAIRLHSDRHDIWIAGLSDDTTTRPDWDKVVGKITDNAPVILMAHDPGIFLDGHQRPVITVAGHTHGMQVNIPVLRNLIGNRFTRAPLRFNHGLIHEDGRYMEVTSGIGTSVVPFRFNAPPEIVSLTISGAASQPSGRVADASKSKRSSLSAN
jgi:predicted MPP superfamily phosphohydrolase